MKRILERIADGARCGHVDPGFADELIKSELSPGQRQMYELIGKYGPLTSTDLIRNHRPDLTIQAAANVLSELNRLGIVKREGCEEDKKSYLYSAE